MIENVSLELRKETWTQEVFGSYDGWVAVEPIGSGRDYSEGRRIQKTLRNMTLSKAAKEKGACQRDRDASREVGKAGDSRKGEPGVHAVLARAPWKKGHSANDKWQKCPGHPCLPL